MGRRWTCGTVVVVDPSIIHTLVTCEFQRLVTIRGNPQEGQRDRLISWRGKRVLGCSTSEEINLLPSSIWILTRCLFASLSTSQNNVIVLCLKLLTSLSQHYISLCFCCCIQKKWYRFLSFSADQWPVESIVTLCSHLELLTLPTSILSPNTTLWLQLGHMHFHHPWRDGPMAATIVLAPSYRGLWSNNPERLCRVSMQKMRCACTLNYITVVMRYCKRQL